MSAELLTPVEVAARLRVHRQSVYRLIWGGRLDYHDISTGKRPRLRISPEALARYIKTTERPA